jgi:hypothetical protein
MLNLSADRILTFLVSVVLIGLAVASLYTRLPAIGPRVVKVRTGSFLDVYAVLELEVASESLRWQADDLQYGRGQQSGVFNARSSHCFIRNLADHRFAHQVFLHFACDRHRE